MKNNIEFNCPLCINDFRFAICVSNKQLRRSNIKESARRRTAENKLNLFLITICLPVVHSEMKLWKTDKVAFFTPIFKCNSMYTNR